MPTSQADFRAAVLDPERAVPHGLTDGSGRPTERRFTVYRNNVTVALMEALRSGFPVLNRLLGAENFDQLARMFARAHPPRSPVMMHYGADMPGFLDGFAPLEHIGYLADVARLELALRRSYHAADATPMDPAHLGSVDPETLMQCRLHLAPAVILVASDWPILDIWRYNTVPDAPKPRSVAQPVLVTRPAFDPAPHALTPAQAQWVQAVLARTTLETAIDQATSCDPEFDLAPLLTLLVQQGALVDMTTPKED